MAIGKPRNGKFPIYVYHAKAWDKARKRYGRKVYVGQADTYEAAARLEQKKKRELALDDQPSERMTVKEYSERWLEVKHGANTRRPARATWLNNSYNIRPFVADFGHRDLKSITRREALDWASKHPNAARSVGAMFMDALDDEYLTVNVWANRRQTQRKGRSNITPLTEQEVDRLAEIAREQWGGYGTMCRAWILFLGWVGCRPGEAFQTCWEDVDLEGGMVTVRRIKPPYNTDRVILPPKAVSALLELPHREGLLFTGIRGRPLKQQNTTYYWPRIRAAFLAELPPERREALTTAGQKLDVYELRHFCASYLVEQGLDEYDGSKQLGNTPEVFRRVYAHLMPDRVNERLRAAFSGSVVDLEDVRKARRTA